MRKRLWAAAMVAAMSAAVTAAAPGAATADSGDAFNCTSTASRVYQVQPFQHRFRVGTHVVRSCPDASMWMRHQSWTVWRQWVRF